MSKLRLDLKVYIDKYGNQYNDGALNVLYPLYKLSNNVYRLYLVSENSFPTITVYFQKADGTITNAYPMGNVGTEEVEGNLWNVYAYDIEDSILDISERVGSNTLSFSFRQANTTSNINSQAIVVQCSYSVNGELPTLSASDYDNVMSSIALTFIARNKDKVFHTTFLPTIITDETDDLYNVGYVYIYDGKYTTINFVPTNPNTNTAYLWNAPTLENAPYLQEGQYYRYVNGEWTLLNNYFLNIGNGYRANSNGTYTQILLGKNYIDNALDNLEIDFNALIDTLNSTLREYVDEQFATINERLTNVENQYLNLNDSFTEFTTYIEENFAKKTDLDSLQTELEGLIASNKIEIENSLATTKSELEADISDLSNTLQDNLNNVEQNLQEQIDNKSTVYFVEWGDE